MNLGSTLSPDRVLQDLRHSLRMLRRNPGFAVVTIATLALGIGMTTAMFSVVNGTVLQPLPYPDADRLVWIAQFAPDWPTDLFLSRGDYLEWKKQAHSFEALAAYGNEEVTLSKGTISTTVQAASISDDFWSIAGATPAVGRLFNKSEQDVAVLSWNLFQSRFGGDAGVIGKTVTLSGHTFSIVGVLPGNFQFQFPPELNAGDPLPDIELYIPLPEPRENPGDPIRQTAQTGPAPVWVRVVGRLGPNVTFLQARAEMQIIYDRVKSRFPRQVGMENRLSFIPLIQRLVGESRFILMMLFGAVGFVLLIAGANFANLLMARASTRKREIAVRSALGASRRDLIRHFLAESIVLATLGGICGLFIAQWAVTLAIRIGGHALPRLADVKIDTHVLLFTLAISLAAGILFGLAPVLGLRTNRVDGMLKGGEGTSSPGAGQLRFRSWLVTIEFALALVLLSGAGLLLKSFWRMNDFPPGFDPNKLVVVNVSLGGPKYFRHWPRQDAYIEELTARASRLPRVQAIGIHCGTLSQSLETVGDALHETGKDTFAVRYVSTGFFSAVRAPLIAGRRPQDEEWRDLKNVVLVNQSFARQYGGGGGIVGKHIRGGLVDAIVIGVIADFKDFQLDARPEAQVYMAYPLAPGMLSMRMFLRTDSPKLLKAALPQLASGIDPDVPVQVQTLDQVLSESITARRFNMYVFEVFAGSALLLALAGVYGVLAYLVKQRTKEIGIRMALGAERPAIVRLMVWQGMKIVLTGMAVGIVAAFSLSRLITSMLYETRASDPLTFAAVTAILALTAILACCEPALRAAHTDPMVALRHE